MFTDPFKKWMNEVDAILVGYVGLEHDDLPDYRWSAEYMDGVSPKTAVEQYFFEYHDDFGFNPMKD
jgi:hypothetical protein